MDELEWGFCGIPYMGIAERIEPKLLPRARSRIAQAGVFQLIESEHIRLRNLLLRPCANRKSACDRFDLHDWIARLIQHSPTNGVADFECLCHLVPRRLLRRTKRISEANSNYVRPVAYTTHGF